MSKNATTRLPLDGNGNPVQTGGRATTATLSLTVTSGFASYTIPKGALSIIAVAPVIWNFAGIGTAGGTEIAIPANVPIALGCTDADGSTIKFFASDGSGGATTVALIVVMGAEY